MSEGKRPDVIFRVLRAEAKKASEKGVFPIVCNIRVWAFSG